ncbi:MAG: cupin domain-containing protein [Candidatus Curtissbacteria bacterium]
MTGYVDNIEKLTLSNTNFRRVIYTAPNSQLVLMCLKPGEEIGEEIHQLDQFLRIEHGKGKAILNGVGNDVGDGDAIIVPQGVKHNLVNISQIEDLKLYTLYSPPNHKDGTIHITKADAQAAEEHFDGKITEE